MSVAFDAKATAAVKVTGATTATNNNLTISAGLTNSVLVASIVVIGAAVISLPSMTWNGVAMTQIGSVAGGGSCQVFLFGLRNPASGNNALVANWTTASQILLDGLSFQGVDQTNDATAFQHANSATGTTSGAASVTITSAVGNYVYGGHAIASGANITATSGTNIYIDNTGGANDGAEHYDVGAASVAMAATIASSTNWASVGIDIVAAAAGGVSVAGPLYMHRTQQRMN